MNNDSNILYVGGYEEAKSADILYDKYQSNIIIFEPIPSFYNLLTWNKKHVEENRVKAAKFNIINKGLGSSNKKLIINKSNVLADGTSLTKQNLESCHENDIDSTECIYIEIEDVSESLKSLNLDKLNDISLLHMNCEGCEFDVLESLIEHDMLKNIPNLIIHTHYADYLQDEIDYGLIDRFCRIQYELSKLHKRIYGHPFLQERWDRDDNATVILRFNVHLPDRSTYFELKAEKHLISSTKHVEQNEYLAACVKSFCKDENIDDLYLCFQVWQKAVHDIKIFLKSN